MQTASHPFAHPATNRDKNHPANIARKNQKRYNSCNVYAPSISFATGLLCEQLCLPLSSIFNEPYASIIPEYFNGKYSGYEINSVLSDDMSELLTSNFINNIYTDADLKIIVDAFEENSLDQWIPKNKMIMYHGTDDITVPYQNSVDTYNSFISLGADKNIVEFIDLIGENHSSGSLPYIVSLFDEFEKLK